jgi:hypothetical protein
MVLGAAEIHNDYDPSLEVVLGVHSRVRQAQKARLPGQIARNGSVKWRSTSWGCHCVSKAIAS